MYDDFGDGKYDHLGIARRVPLHALKALKFLKVGDLFNALAHAKACLWLSAWGYQGTRPWRVATWVREFVDSMAG